jgi:hypothetical protein
MKLNEAIQTLADEKMDLTIKSKFGGKALTYEYSKAGALELARISKDVLITKDNKFMHINTDVDSKKLNDIVKKYNLKLVD